MRYLIPISLSLILLLLILPSISAAVAVPKIEPYVNDFANLLTTEQENSLNILCDAIEKNTTWEIAIVTINDVGGDDPVLFANKIGDQNGVGKKDKSNGIVILWSIKDGGAIAPGRYSESIFNDAKVGRIGRSARPLFDEGKPYEGFLYIINEMNKEITGKDIVNTTIQADNNNSSGSDNSILIIIFVLFVLLVIWKLTGIAVIPFGLPGFGGGGGGGRSFGSGSFGGGGSRF